MTADGRADREPGPIGRAQAGPPIRPPATTSAITLARTHDTLARCGCGQLVHLSPAPSAADLHSMYVDQYQFGASTDPLRALRIVRCLVQSPDRIAAARPLRILGGRRQAPRKVTVGRDAAIAAHLAQDDSRRKRVAAPGNARSAAGGASGAGRWPSLRRPPSRGASAVARSRLRVLPGIEQADSLRINSLVCRPARSLGALAASGRTRRRRPGAASICPSVAKCCKLQAITIKAPFLL
jgi:hypothetical protein